MKTKIKLPEPPTNLKYYKSWDKATKYKCTGPKGEEIYLVTNYNCCYGELIKSWQLNNNRFSSVKHKLHDKYPSIFPEFVVFDCSNGLMGIRPFERNSFIYEFLYKTLELKFDEKDIPSAGKDGWDKHYDSFYFFRKTLIENGGEFK